MHISFVPTRRLFVSLALFIGAASIPLHADVYLAPGATGSGSSVADPRTASDFQIVINNLAAGETVYLCSGTYTQKQILIEGSGTATAPKRIVGLDTGGGLPLFDGNFNPETNSASSSTDFLFKFSGTTAHWHFKDLQIREHGFVIDMPLDSNGMYTKRAHILFENIAMDTIEDGIRTRNAEHVTVRNCTVIRHTKKAFRIGRYSRYITFENCHTDATGGNDLFKTRSIPVGFFGDSTSGLPLIHDVKYINCTARNNRFKQSSTDYWNGDGFSTERGTYNVTYSRCGGFDNHDAAFDDKGSNITYDNCIALRNKRGFRVWATATFTNCVSAFNEKAGGTGSSNGVWVGSKYGFAAVHLSTFHNNAGSQVFEDYSPPSGEPDAKIQVYDSVLSIAEIGSGLATGNVEIFNSALHNAADPNSDPSPNYVNAIATWEGTPKDAFNSGTYSPGKGYFGQGATTTTPAAPTALSGSVNQSSADRIDLIWTDESNNEVVFEIERAVGTDAFALIGTVGTNVTQYMDVGLAPGTSYRYRVRARNGSYVSAYSAIATVATPALTAPAAPDSVTVAADENTPGAVKLAWSDRANNESDYYIERATDGVNFVEVASTRYNVTSHTLTGQNEGQSYEFRVRAGNAAGYSSYSNVGRLLVPHIRIIDNLDSSYVVATGNWVLASVATDRYGANYLHDVDTRGGMSVKFTPSLSSGAQYRTYAWWTDGSNRSSVVPIDIAHAGGTSTTQVSQRSNGGQWNLLGTYTFTSGSMGSITIRNDGANGYVIADAVKWVSVPVNPVAPSNLAATATSGTQISLTWTDNATNETAFVITRSTDGNTFVQVGTAAINATSFNDSGLVEGNTYFYRVRAAGSSGDSSDSNTASTITPLTIVLDNTSSSGVTISSGWTVGTVAGGYNGSYLHDGNTGSAGGKSVLYSAPIPSSGAYEVFLWYPASKNRATNTPVDVNHADGTTTITINQRYNGDKWHSIGTYVLSPGAGASVRIRNDAANGYVIADAVRFVRVAQ